MAQWQRRGREDTAQPYVWADLRPDWFTSDDPKSFEVTIGRRGPVEQGYRIGTVDFGDEQPMRAGSLSALTSQSMRWRRS